MERRLILAVLMSYVIIVGWSFLFPVKRQIQSKSSQIVQNNKLTNKENSQVPSSVSVLTNNTLEQFQILENEQFKIQFSNIGGTISSLTIKQYNYTLPITKILYIPELDTKIYNLDWFGGNRILYTYKDDSISITKEYTIDQNFRITSKISYLSNLKSSNLKIAYYDIDLRDKSEKYFQEHRLDLGLYEHVVDTGKTIDRKNNAFNFSDKDAKEVFGPVKWIGFRDKYFCAIIKGNFDSTGYQTSVLDKRHFRVLSNVQNESGKTLDLNFTIFAGPERLDILQKTGDDFDRIKRYYRWGIFDGVAKGILHVLEFIHKIIGNWGLSIVAVSLIIYSLMYPLTMTGLKSMKKMQALQPQMAKLKEKYKNNPQKMNEELVELYRINKINPLSGCLPLLLQMPIFLGLYQVLYRSVYFQGSKFLWIKDLSKPDALVHFGTNFPLIGSEFNLLPLLMVVIMFFQQKFTNRNMIATTPEQEAQQKMMAYLMPVMMGVIFYHFPSGLTLYFTVFYILQTIAQWRMSLETAGKA